MASQEESQFRGLVTSWPALAALAVTMLSFLVANPNLKSARPTDMGGGVRQELRAPEVPARLWQDPRTSVIAGRCQTSLLPLEMGMPDDDFGKETRDILVLLALGDADLTPEQMETRRRERYATLAALNTAGYVPVKSERLSYVDLDLDSHVEGPCSDAKDNEEPRKPDTEPKSECTGRIRVPFEWVQPVEKAARHPGALPPRYRGVCVLWLYYDVDPGNLVRSLGLLKNKLAQQLRTQAMPGACNFAVTGRITSTKLRRLFNDDKRLEAAPKSKDCKGCLQDVTLYVTNATAQDIRYREDKPGASSLNAPAFSGLKLEYVIGHDQELLKTLVDELQNRGVDMTRDKIAIISEWDTVYGRAMHQGFLKAIAGQAGTEGDKGESGGKGSGKGGGKGSGKGGGGGHGQGGGTGRGGDGTHSNVHLQSYLRGLDGKLPGVKAEAPSDDDKGSGSSRPAEASGTKPGAVEGEGDAQVDYLRRLVERMSAMRKSFKAIGILGSDVYDKLLILKALRSHFPEALFFTTDLDVRLLQPAESMWTRNLIIASHFGLSLNKDLQGTIPPFRSGYDTASYLGCLRAVEYSGLAGKLSTRPEKGPNNPVASLVPAGENNQHTEMLPVHLYEIARSGMFELTILDEDADPVGERNYRRDARYLQQNWQWWLPLVLGCAVPLAFILWTVSRGWQRFLREVGSSLRFKDTPTARVVIALSGVVLALGLALLIGSAHYQTAEEPFSMVERISVWPTILFRLFAVLLCIYYVCTAIADLADRNEKIRAEFDLSGATPAPLGPALGWRTRLGASLHASWQMWQWSPRDDNVAQVWQQFEEYGSIINRVCRCALVFVVNLILFVMLLFLLEFPVHLGRGILAPWATKIALGLSAVALISLLVFVVDATVLCNRFVTYLARHASGWSGALLEKYARQRGLTLPPEGSADGAIRPALDQWLMIRLVAAATDVVDQLIYYPFVVLLVLIVAQNPLFIAWTWNVPLISVALLSAGTALLCALILQKSARHARAQALEALDRALLPVAGLAVDRSTQESIQQIRAEIEGMNAGVFASFAQNPIVYALFLPLVGGGGLAALEALLPYL